jgi:hypothetical protein
MKTPEVIDKTMNQWKAIATPRQQSVFAAGRWQHSVTF